MRFLTIGDSCTDVFIYGKCERICPEAPVPVFSPVKEHRNGGMARNVQANVIALGVDCDVLTHTNEILKTRYVDIKTNQMLLRVDEDDKAENKFSSKGIEWSVYDAVLVSNYCKGFITMGDVRDICAYHNNVYLDSNKCEIHVDLPLNLRYLKINEQELEINPFLKHHLKPDAGHQSDYTRPAQIIVTRGYKGCDYMGKTYPPPRRVVAQDLAGAGDTFLAALAVATTRGESPDVAINFANDCSTTVVAKRGVRTV